MDLDIASASAADALGNEANMFSIRIERPDPSDMYSRTALSESTARTVLRACRADAWSRTSYSVGPGRR